MDTMEEVVPAVPTSRKPPGDSFRQQRMASWQPVMTPLKIIVLFLAVGVCFIPTGTSIVKSTNSIFEQRQVYDGSNPDYVQCQIGSANEGKKCSISFTFDGDVQGPILVYYELNNYYQNHRRYVNSYYSTQLQGANIGASDPALVTACSPLSKIGNFSLNPCGLIANSFFSDVITLTSSSVPGSSLDETDISLSYERGKKFKQVTGFQSVQVASSSVTCDSVGLPTDCKTYVDSSSGLTYKFFYPNDNTVQYLYETYPKQISPVRGVTDEHFIVWMRSSSLPKFRKLYGRIHENFKKGDILKFQVEANFEVRSFNADKAILITTESQFGAANPELGVAYIVVGSVSLFLGLLFSFKQCLYPRPLGNPRDLKWIK